MNKRVESQITLDTSSGVKSGALQRPIGVRYQTRRQHRFVVYVALPNIEKTGLGADNTLPTIDV